MQRPLSMLSDHSVASTNSVAGPSSGLRAQRQRPKLTGPRTRKPTAKSTLPDVIEAAPQQAQLHTQALPPLPTSAPLPTNASAYELVPAEQRPPERDECADGQGEEEGDRSRDSIQSKRPQSEQLPSYVQSQQFQQTTDPPRPFSPGPPSAVASDSSCAFPQRAAANQRQSDTPSAFVSVSAMPSPVQTSSPNPLPGLQPESSSRQLHDSPMQLPTLLSPEDVSSTGPVVDTSAIAAPSKPSTPTLRPETPVSIKSRTVSTTPVHIQHPAPVDFSSAPIAWKALTLDAAQWTFSSSELQAIVSRAIRASAEPTSIRLLSLQTIDQELAEETRKLESERMQEQAKYRFTMQRRTMLLQSLNAVSNASGSGTNASISPSVSTFSQSGAGPSSHNPGAELVHRLADISISLDTITQNLLRISDQLSQIRQLQDTHAASALAVALRKLNASYARRVKEVLSLKEKLGAAEAERDEAWRLAEQLASEADADADEDFEDILTGDVVNVERAVAVPATLTRASQVGVPIKIKTPGVGPRVRMRSDAPNEGDSEDQGLPDESAVDLSADADNGEEIFSPESAQEGSRLSHASIPRRRRANSATSRVTAARTRSQRASKASLRFPRGRNHDRDVGSEGPPSAYSRASSRGHSRQRSRSRAGSFSGPSSSPLDANVISPAQAARPVPDVPKIPDAAELSRLETAKAAEAAAKTLSPMTAGTGSGSFLDMLSRANSAIDGKVEEGVESAIPPVDGLESNSEAHDDSVSSMARPAMHPRPLSDSKVAVMSPTASEALETTAALKLRPSLQVYPPTWTRLPPIDSPKDVTRNSDPHRADDNELSGSSEDEDELADEFEIAYARTLPQAARPNRSPLRLQHTQSMLPFPRPDANGFPRGMSVDDNAVKSPQSNSDARSGDGGIYEGSHPKRPASLGGNPATYL